MIDPRLIIHMYMNIGDGLDEQMRLAEHHLSEETYHRLAVKAKKLAVSLGRSARLHIEYADLYNTVMGQWPPRPPSRRPSKAPRRPSSRPPARVLPFRKRRS